MGKYRTNYRSVCRYPIQEMGARRHLGLERFEADPRQDVRKHGTCEVQRTTENDSHIRCGDIPGNIAVAKELLETKHAVSAATHGVMNGKCHRSRLELRQYRVEGTLTLRTKTVDHEKIWS